MSTLNPLTRRRRVPRVFIRGALTIVCLSALMQTSLLSQNVAVNYLYPNANTVLESNGTQVIPAGGATFYTFGSVLQTVVKPASITITSPTGITALMDAVPFSGLQYTFAGATISGVTIDPASNVPGFDLSSIRFSGGEVRLNLQSLNLFPGFNIQVQVNFGPSVLAASATTVNFSYQAGSAAPASQTIQLSSTGAAVPFSAAFNGNTTSPASLVIIAPTSGTTPSPLVLSLNQTVLSTLASGTYSGNVVVSSSAIPGGDQIIKVNLTVTPVLTSGSLANGATYVAGGLVPGSWAQVKGIGLSNVTRTWDSPDFAGLGNNLPTSLSGVQVRVNNVLAAVYYISPIQVSFQVPDGISGTASVQVLTNGVASNPVTSAAASSSPGIFPIIVNGTNYPAGVFLDGKFVGDPSIGPAFRNAKPGDIIQLFATGLVPTPAGVLPNPQAVSGVRVTIGNVTFPADFAGLVAVGEFQINMTVPQQFASLPAGTYPISIQVNGVSSPVTINSIPPGQIVLPIQH